MRVLQVAACAAPGDSVESLVPRYTRRVSLLARIASVPLIVLLAGGPAVAAVCEAMCVAPAEPPESSATRITHNPGHHHPVAVETSGVAEVAHSHHQSTESAAASSRDSEGTRALGRDCCDRPALARVSLTASRGDTDLLPGSLSALVSSAAMLAIHDRQPVGPTHGPPPGALSPARVPLILRI